MVWTGTTLAGWLGLGSVLAVGAALPGAVGTTCARLDRWLTPRLLRQAVSLALGTTMATLALPAGAANGAGLSRVAGQADSTPDPVDSPTAASSASAATTATTETTATAEVLQPAGTSPDPAFSPTGTPSPTATPVSADPLSTVGAPPPGWRPSPPPRIVDTDESRLLAPTPRSTVPDATITVLRGDTLWHIAARHLGPGATDAEIALEWPRWHDANRDVIGADADLLVPGQQLRPPTSGSSR
jgi:nucleoid-associated protein YgaU